MAAQRVIEYKLTCGSRYVKSDKCLLSEYCLTCVNFFAIFGSEAVGLSVINKDGE